MPRQDKTGPEGKGPKTGRGLGVCDDNTGKKTVTPWGRRRPGMGRGGGLGRGRGLASK